MRMFRLNGEFFVKSLNKLMEIMFLGGTAWVNKYEQQCIGIVLTGASGDGSQGLHRVKANGGLTLVQDPATAEFNTMPKAAIQATEVDHVFTLEEMGRFLISIVRGASYCLICSLIPLWSMIK
jgi:hypothetical protein